MLGWDVSPVGGEHDEPSPLFTAESRVESSLSLLLFLDLHALHSKRLLATRHEDHIATALHCLAHSNVAAQHTHSSRAAACSATRRENKIRLSCTSFD